MKDHISRLMGFQVGIFRISPITLTHLRLDVPAFSSNFQTPPPFMPDDVKQILRPMVFDVSFFLILTP